MVSFNSTYLHTFGATACANDASVSVAPPSFADGISALEKSALGATASTNDASARFAPPSFASLSSALLKSAFGTS